MQDLHALRDSLTPEQASILDEVWDYFLVQNTWIPTRHLHQTRGGKRPLLSKLSAIGGSIIYQHEDAQNLFYRLTFLGILLTKNAADYERLLADFLQYVAKKYSTEHQRTHISNHDVERDLQYSPSQLQDLRILLAEAPIMRGGNRSPTEWNLEIPREIEDLPEDAIGFVRARALENYDPQEPVEAEDRSRYWQTRRPPRTGLISPLAFPLASIEESYVDASRIAELDSIRSSRFDLARLLQICRELNTASANGSYLSVAMLARALIDHIPPIFGLRSFSEIQTNYASSRSFKESMNHLDLSCRKIADAHLHVQIRAQEVLPTRTQVNFSNDIDVLLAEVVRVLRAQ